MSHEIALECANEQEHHTVGGTRDCRELESVLLGPGAGLKHRGRSEALTMAGPR